MKFILSCLFIYLSLPLVDVFASVRGADKHINNEDLHNVMVQLSSAVSTIYNDQKWYDIDGHETETNKGGRVTKINGNFYWLGGSRNEIYIYKSSTMGSNTWKKVLTIPHSENMELGNCHLQHHPVYNTNHIFCKNRAWFKSNNSNPAANSYIQLPNPGDPQRRHWPFRDGHYGWGGQSTFRDNTSLYLVVTRCDRPIIDGQKQPCNTESRQMCIYKLNDDWTAFADWQNVVVSNFSYVGRESPWIVRYNNWYYLFVSQTRDFKQSRTFYKRASSLSGFQDATENLVVMHPPDKGRIMQSQGSQFRYLIEVESGKWVFGGDRYPDEDRANWDPKYGKDIVIPADFVNGVPNVYWKATFDWMNYPYGSGQFDAHNHGPSGHAPTPAIVTPISMTLE